MVELLVLGILALIIVGPKDLPRLMYGAGKMMGRVRKMADEFRSGFDQMAKEVEIEEMRRELDELKQANISSDVESALGDADKAIRDDKPSRKEA